MKSVVRRRKLVVFGVGSLILVALFMEWAAGGVSVVVMNWTSGPLTHVQIEFVGGSVTIPQILPRTSITEVVNPSSESSLTLHFKDATGKRRSEPIDVYIERNYRGKILITVQPDGQVTHRDHSRFGYFH